MQDLPVVGGHAPQPRLAANTDKSLLHDVNEPDLAPRREKEIVGPGRMMHEQMVEPTGIEPATSSLQS